MRAEDLPPGVGSISVWARDVLSGAFCILRVPYTWLEGNATWDLVYNNSLEIRGRNFDLMLGNTSLYENVGYSIDDLLWVRELAYDKGVL